MNKLFNNKEIRTVWDKEEEKYYISVVDIIEELTKSKRPRKYWSDLKKKLLDEGHIELSEKIGQLKLKSSDGKYYLTDVCDIEEMFRIIESVPSKNAEPIKQWLAHLGSGRIDEVFDPSIAAQRAIDLYRSKGYDEKWISKRMQGIQDRKGLTDVWKDGGITEDKEYAILTNVLYKGWSGMTAKEYKEFKGLRKENLRDNMDSLEVSLTDISEEVTKRLAIKRKPQGLEENIEAAKKGSGVAKNTREDIEELLGETIITNKNRLNYQYVDNKELE
ncbi:MAG: phage antirepressor protein [Bacilli bacterium]|nr:phage antirepressor protein [Bacilli bacterium]